MRFTAAVAVLAAGLTAWTALPAGSGRAGTRPLLVLAIISAVLTVTQLAASLFAARTEVRPRLDAAAYRSPLATSVRRTAAGGLALPWPQALIVSALALEALHPARPWHTAVLGAVLLAFVLTLHLADSGDGARVLRPQLPLLVAGLGLAALSAGAALLPPAGSGWLAVAAAIAAVLVAGLAVPLG
ncbi:MAG TPA: hypothetical protein VF843_13000 [Streptosporangiaceae bacterium]